MTLGGCVYLGNENEIIFHSIITTLLTLRLPVEYNASFNVNRVFAYTSECSDLLFCEFSPFLLLLFRFASDFAFALACIPLILLSSTLCVLYFSFLCCLPVFFRIVIPFAKLLKFCPHSFAFSFFYKPAAFSYMIWFSFYKRIVSNNFSPEQQQLLPERETANSFILFFFQILVKVCPL